MRTPSYEQLEPYENKWVALRKPDQQVVGSGRDVSEAKRDAATRGYTDVIFLKVYPFNWAMSPPPMKFPYVRQPYSIDPKLPYIARPLIPIRLSLKAIDLETYALLDSGADRSLFHSRFADELLIDLETGRKEFYFGIGAQPVPVYHHKIEIQVLGSQYWIDVEVGFTDAPGVDAILGQADFFAHHQIKFERYKESIEINTN